MRQQAGYSATIDTFALFHETVNGLKRLGKDTAVSVVTQLHKSCAEPPYLENLIDRECFASFRKVVDCTLDEDDGNTSLLVHGPPGVGKSIMVAAALKVP